MIATYLLFFLVKRKKEYFLLCVLTIILAEYLIFILIYIAKKGGIGGSLSLVLFLSDRFRKSLQYMRLTLGQQGYGLALGRHLFPWVFLLAVLHYSDLRLTWLRQRKWVLGILPVLSLILYYPAVFSRLINTKGTQSLVIYGTLSWILLYLLTGIVLLVMEPGRVRIRYIRESVLKRCVMLISIAALYLIYCPQDPAQVYLFYKDPFMTPFGLWYLNPFLSPETYLVIIIVTFVALLLGLYSMVSIAKMEWSEDQDDVRLQLKYDAASLGGSVFIHGIKNQLLANRVLCKRLNEQLDSETPDIELMQGYARQLTENNVGLLSHVEELYKSFKSNQLSMRTCDLRGIIDGAVKGLRQKYPMAQVEVEVPEGLIVFADETHLRAAIVNIMVNGWEATVSAGKELPLSITCYEKRRDIGIYIQDHGTGIGKYELNKIFDPFYSSKNSNSNWGLGLYYVRSIVDQHRGTLKVESEYGQGTGFYLLLPKLLPERSGKKR